MAAFVRDPLKQACRQIYSQNEARRADNLRRRQGRSSGPAADIEHIGTGRQFETRHSALADPFPESQRFVIKMIRCSVVGRSGLGLCLLQWVGRNGHSITSSASDGAAAAEPRLHLTAQEQPDLLEEALGRRLVLKGKVVPALERDEASTGDSGRHPAPFLDGLPEIAAPMHD
jgi:hypothetical protein